MDNAFARLPVPHFFRLIVLQIAWFFSLCAFLLPGIIWKAAILDKTGYRKIDLLWYFVPVANTIVFTRTQWRYCSTVKYWEPAVAAPAVADLVAA